MRQDYQKTYQLKIILVSYEFPPLGGGVATAVKSLVDSFPDHNIRIDIVTSSATNKWKTSFYSDTAIIHHVPIGNKSKSYQNQTPLNMILFTIFSTVQIFKLLRKNDYDLIHFFGYPGAWPGLLFRNKTPYIISLRGVDVPGYNQKFGLWYRLYKPLTMLSWKYASHIVSNSKWLEHLAHQNLTNIDSSKWSIIPNGVDTDKFKPVPDKEKLDHFSVTAGGTLLNPKKDHKHLITGFAKLRKRHNDARLLLFGEGELLKELIDLVDQLGIKDAVEFRGRVDTDTLATQLPKCHVFCLPSLAEGMSNAALEALASGLPLIMTPVGAANEMIIEGENGYIVPVKDSNSIYQALKKIYNDADLRKKMGDKSREIAQGFNPSSTAKAYAKLYSKVTQAINP